MRHPIIPLLAAAASILSAGPISADLGDQLAHLFPDDGAAGDQFGRSVAISGSIAIVGTRHDDDLGASSGSAYLFDAATGEQLFKLLPDDGAADDQFGRAVAISGSTAIVGALYDDVIAINSGSAYVFDVATGEQIAKLVPNDGAPHDNFGRSVAIDGSIAIVGAYLDNANGTNTGSAYLFDATTGQQLFKLVPALTTGDEFGTSVAISGATAIVGSPGNLSGTAYIFDISDPTSPTELFEIMADDGAERDRFGYSVAISGATAIIGAYLDDDNGTRSGSAYLFDTATGEQLFKLLPDDGAEDDEFGVSVAISGDIAIVGANEKDPPNNGGAAYLFDVTTGAQIAKLLPGDPGAQDHFGFSVGISGATAIVGANLDDIKGAEDSDFGSAYLFDAAAPGKCPWDLDVDGNVGTGDLILLLGSWDDPYGTPDLIELLGNWGPCPK